MKDRGEATTHNADGHVVSTRGGREDSPKGKFPRAALKMQHAHTNRLLHMLSASENELMAQNKQVAELELTERARDANIGEKSDEQGSKRERALRGWGWKEEGRNKRRRMEVLMWDGDGWMRHDDPVLSVVCSLPMVACAQYVGASRGD
ncbi:hypothetical protein EON63_08025 [archaeon]|nr:MAG: hypothetical protein EON63_08025 [archaeon]